MIAFKEAIQKKGGWMKEGISNSIHSSQDCQNFYQYWVLFLMWLYASMMEKGI